MFGMGATSDETTIPGYTQLLFDDIVLNNSIQIINAGIQDANTKTEYKIIEQKIKIFYYSSCFMILISLIGQIL